MRGRMYPSVGNVIQPGDKPVLHLLKTVEGLTFQEGIPDVAQHSFELALSLGGGDRFADPWCVSIASSRDALKMIPSSRPCLSAMTFALS